MAHLSQAATVDTPTAVMETALALVARFAVPLAVAEFLASLAADYPTATHLRIARHRDDTTLRRFTKLEKDAARSLPRGVMQSYAENFYWDGVAYLIGFSYTT